MTAYGPLMKALAFAVTPKMFMGCLWQLFWKISQAVCGTVSDAFTQQ